MDKLKHIEELDGLRGVAILLVLVWHYFHCQIDLESFAPIAKQLKHLASWSWSGVDLFFVLSGFLIGRIILTYKHNKDFFKTFYIRRFLRILPAYYVLLISYIIFSSTALDLPPSLISNPLPLASYILYIQNFFMQESFGAGWLSITWSLAIEEQFYLVVPLLLFLFKKKQVVGLIIIGICLGPLVRMVLQGAGWYSFLLLPARIDSLMMGVFIAYLYVNNNIYIFKEHYKTLRIVLIMLLVFIFLWVISEETGVIGGAVSHSLIGLFYSLCLLYVLAAHPWETKFLKWSLLKFIGKISYGIYLYHQVVHGLLSYYITGEDVTILNSYDDIYILALSFLVTVAVAYLSFKFIEKPLLNIGKRYSYT